MSKATIFGIEWEAEQLNPDFTFPIWKCNHNGIGTFYTTNKNELNCNTSEYYKIISLIHEKSTFSNPYFFSSKEINNILREKYPYFANGNYSLSTIEECIASFPTSFTEKQERSLRLLYNKYPEHGAVIDYVDTKQFCFFSKAKNDYSLIINAMVKKELIEGISADDDDSDDCYILLNMKIAEKGWEFIENNFSASNSKQGFIAMWFDEKMISARDAIKKAISDTNVFTPRIIDEKQFNGDIPDEITKEISSSKFVVADLTGQRGGVYFEAGYAMAKNIPVIFTCKDSPDEKVHFDVNHNNIIFWNNENELYVKLFKRIKETITKEAPNALHPNRNQSN